MRKAIGIINGVLLSVERITKVVVNAAIVVLIVIIIGELL